MAADARPAVAWTPEKWWVAFHRRPSRRWLGLVVPGRYKHVCVFGFVPGSRAWLFIEVTLTGTHIAVVPDAAADGAIGDFIFGADVVEMRARGMAWPKPGLWCVPATAHLLGLPGCALRPDALFRQCLRHGGRLIGNEDTRDEDQDFPAGPGNAQHGEAGQG